MHKRHSDQGHAIECINAEDPAKDSCLPQVPLRNHVPEAWVFADSKPFTMGMHPSYYDSMKLIVHGDTREKAMAGMKRALGEFILHGKYKY